MRLVVAGIKPAAITASPPNFPPRFLTRLFKPHNRPRGIGGHCRGFAKVRLIIGITLLLLGLGNLSCQLQSSVDDGPVMRPAGQWVRTVDGWERTELWNAPPLHVPRLHPLTVAAGQALFSVMGLVACAGNGRPRRRCQQE